MSQQGQSQTSLRSHLKVKEPSLYDVIFINDDFTTMEFVVEVLSDVFFLTPEKAEAIMLDVHYNGSAVVGTYTFDVAKSKVAKATQMARQEGFPLRIQIKEHK